MISYAEIKAVSSKDEFTDIFNRQPRNVELHNSLFPFDRIHKGTLERCAPTEIKGLYFCKDIKSEEGRFEWIIAQH